LLKALLSRWKTETRSDAVSFRSSFLCIFGARGHIGDFIMNKFTLAALAATVLSLALAGCQGTTPQQQRAGTGALIGAAGGALAGQAIGRDTKSTVIGAAGGALLGAVVGTATTPQGQRDGDMCRYRAPDGQIYVAQCDERYYSGQY